MRSNWAAVCSSLATIPLDLTWPGDDAITWFGFVCFVVSIFLIDWIYAIKSFITPFKDATKPSTMPQTEPETAAATVRVEKAVAVLDR